MKPLTPLQKIKEAIANDWGHSGLLVGTLLIEHEAKLANSAKFAVFEQLAKLLDQTSTENSLKIFAVSSYHLYQICKKSMYQSMAVSLLTDSIDKWVREAMYECYPKIFSLLFGDVEEDAFRRIAGEFNGFVNGHTGEFEDKLVEYLMDAIDVDIANSIVIDNLCSTLTRVICVNYRLTILEDDSKISLPRTRELLLACISYEVILDGHANIKEVTPSLSPGLIYYAFCSIHGDDLLPNGIPYESIRSFEVANHVSITTPIKDCLLKRKPWIPV